MSASITSLRDGHRLVSVEEEEAYRQGLQRLATIGSGKKGSRQPRHVLEERGNDTRVPGGRIGHGGRCDALPVAGGAADRAARGVPVATRQVDLPE